MSEKFNPSEVEKTENIHRQILDNLPTPIGYFNGDGKYIYRNQSCKTLQGSDIFFDIFAPGQKLEIENQIKDFNPELGPIKFEYSNNDKFYKCEIYKSVDQLTPTYIFQATDISKEKKELIESNYDKVTGVYNRNFAETELNRLCSDNKARNNLSVALLDIDGFKIINDFWSYKQGDKFLKDIAQSLKSEFRKTDMICRWGGDEFMLILPDCQDNEEKIVKQIKEIGLINNIRLSVGFATRKVGETKTREMLLQEVEEKYKKDKGPSSREKLARAYGE